MKQKRVVVIDTQNRKIYESEISTLKDMQKIVSGYVERGFTLENGDEVYVNEDGLNDETLKAFYIEGAHQPFAGNAFVIGKVTSSGNNRAAQSSVKEVINRVRWIEWVPFRSGWICILREQVVT